MSKYFYNQVSQFCENLRYNLSADNRFPNFGMENELNCMANNLNPMLRGCHLKLNGGKWGLGKGLAEDQLEHSIQVVEPQEAKKLNPTELLKQQLREKTAGLPQRSRIFEEPSSAFEEEMRKYEANDQDAPEGTDMLQWWKQHALEYPRFESVHKN